MAGWDTYPENAVGDSTWFILTENSAVDELTNTAWTHLNSQLGSGDLTRIVESYSVEVKEDTIEVEIVEQVIDIDLEEDPFGA